MLGWFGGGIVCCVEIWFGIVGRFLRFPVVLSLHDSCVYGNLCRWLSMISRSSRLQGLEYYVSTLKSRSGHNLLSISVPSHVLL